MKRQNLHFGETILKCCLLNHIFQLTRANSADDKLVIYIYFCLFFPENRFLYFIKIVSLHEISAPIF